jgi:hypothetical protein
LLRKDPLHRLLFRNKKNLVDECMCIIRGKNWTNGISATHPDINLRRNLVALSALKRKLPKKSGKLPFPTTTAFTPAKDCRLNGINVTFVMIIL